MPEDVNVPEQDIPNSNSEYTLLDLILNKQHDLMQKVPHTLRPDSFIKMQASLQLLDTLMRYLGSTGHKPWRPNPLSSIVQAGLMADLKEKFTTLSYIHSTTLGGDRDFSDTAHYQRQLTSGFGIIEESVEYLNSLRIGTRSEQLEELVDILFFFLEQMLLNEFTWPEIIEEYNRKWSINIKRYEDSKAGDYSWDKRAEQKL